jgi:hypothetical protein
VRREELRARVHSDQTPILSYISSARFFSVLGRGPGLHESAGLLTGHHYVVSLLIPLTVIVAFLPLHLHMKCFHHFQQLFVMPLISSIVALNIARALQVYVLWGHSHVNYASTCLKNSTFWVLHNSRENILFQWKDAMPDRSPRMDTSNEY